MIKNERQYGISKKKAEKFRLAIIDFDREAAENGCPKNIHPKIFKAQRDTLVTFHKELIEQLKEYEMLKNGEVQVLHGATLQELPKQLIRARIALGMTQKQLALRLGKKEQQIQRWEDSNFETVAIKTLAKIKDALGLRISESIFLPAPEQAKSILFNSLLQVGLTADFVRKRLLPIELIKREFSGVDSIQWSKEAARHIEWVYGWSINALMGGEPLLISKSACNEARFKLPEGRKEDFVTAFTVYARKLSYLLPSIVKGAKPLESLEKPTDIYKKICNSDGYPCLKKALEYVWGLGVIVLPLGDGGVFHGACFRKDGINIIVLKQKQNVSYESKWLFDLFHELYHAFQHPDIGSLAYIEHTDSLTQLNRKEEEAANKFAAEVCLNGKSQALLQNCFKDASYEIKYLKRSVKSIAKNFKVSQGLLALQVAHEAKAEYGWNWWGAAANLQRKTEHPLETTRQIFLSRTDLSKLGNMERSIIQRAFED
ncbi:MAG: helix-turn-helix domain-containing protein [Magnetococcales bacterium]|nr:helix-turn-helix domain-containing protein [Magnetococcales bacterium]